MSGERRPHTGLANCTCETCDLINCGAIDRSWDGWPWVWLSGEARVLTMILTRQPPVRGSGPKTRWAGCVDWFRVMGAALNFDDAMEDDDEPA
jgi:hypothetical protein